MHKRSDAHFNSRAALLLQQNIFRFHVAVDYFELIESVQALKQRVSKLANQLQAETLKLVLLDQLVQIYVQKFKHNAHVRPEHKVIKPISKQTSWMSIS